MQPAGRDELWWMDALSWYRAAALQLWPLLCSLCRSLGAAQPLPVAAAALPVGHWVSWGGRGHPSPAVGTLQQRLPHPTAVTLVLLLQVRDWTEDESSNRGLLVTVHGLGGSPLDSPAVQFASSRDHHESKKPMLVLFTDDGRRGASLPMADFPGRCCTPQHSSVPRYLACRVLGLLLFSSG